jgi:hypothetical protein
MEGTVIERPIPTGEGLTFEKVWAMFQETDKKFQETDRQFKETDRKIQETDRIVKRNGRQLGKLHNKFGNLAEHLVAPGIAKRFNELGYHFHLVAKKGGEITDKNGKTLTQIDILLENFETIIAVEVKARPVEKDVGHHIKRLGILRDTMRGEKAKIKILGAIAGAIFEDSVKEAVRDAGFFVIEQSGDTMKIDMPEGWQPVAY